jgi:hypothetical protein
MVEDMRSPSAKVYSRSSEVVDQSLSISNPIQTRSNRPNRLDNRILTVRVIRLRNVDTADALDRKGVVGLAPLVEPHPIILAA